jgi:hypothetical protein
VRREVVGLLEVLLAASAPGSVMSLDAVGEAIGDRAVTADEIAWLLDQLAAAAREVGGPEGEGALSALGKVLPAARAVAARLGRPATIDELAASTGLAPGEVRRALLLAKVMGR